MSTDLSNDQIRLIILDAVYKQELKEPGHLGLDRVKMMEILNIPENIMDFNVIYLEQKGLVKCMKLMGSVWYMVNITAYGTDVIENKGKFKDTFSFVNTTIQVNGPNYGNIIQATNNSTVNFSQQVTDAFKKAHELIETKEGISAESREEIRQSTKALEAELKSKEMDAGKIQQIWKWLNKNANWIVPTLTQVVTVGIKIACGLPP